MNSKLCAIGIAIVVIAPVILGFGWPTGTETKTAYETGTGTDITQSLVNADAPIYGPSRSPMNNLMLIDGGSLWGMQPEAAAYSETQSSYPQTVGGAIKQSSYVSGLQSIYGGSNYVKVEFAGSFKIHAGPTESVYEYGILWVQTMAFTGLTESGSVETVAISKGMGIVAYDSQLFQYREYEETGLYVDTTEGYKMPEAASVWINGYRNDAVDFILEKAAGSVTIGDVRLTSSNGSVTARVGTASQELGAAYNIIKVTLRSDGERIVTGLMGEGLGDSLSEGQRLHFSGSEGMIESLSIQGSAGWRWMCSSADIQISTSRIMDDAIIVPYSYYPDNDWMVTIANPAVIGDDITIGNIPRTYAVTDGTIAVTNVTDGSVHVLPVRNLKIMSVVDGGAQKIFIGGVLVHEQDIVNRGVVHLGGDWYASVVIAHVDVVTTDVYVWDPGAFSLSAQGYCMAGLLSCCAVAVGGSLWGRQQGSSVLALHLCMAMAAAGYLIFMG